MIIIYFFTLRLHYIDYTIIKKRCYRDIPDFYGSNTLYVIYAYSQISTFKAVNIGEGSTNVYCVNCFILGDIEI